jgi:hypothetical protein
LIKDPKYSTYYLYENETVEIIDKCEEIGKVFIKYLSLCYDKSEWVSYDKLELRSYTLLSE